MTSNDAQIDVLLRRYAGHANSNAATEHLDADELNAFAERKLPSASRARYASHLADCDDCRRLMSQLAVSAGAVVTEATSPADARDSLRQKLARFFAPSVLRYAAFAVVLTAVVGIALLIVRRSSRPDLVAQNEPSKQTQVGVVKPDEKVAQADNASQSAQEYVDRSGTVSKPAQNSNLETKRDESKVAENTAPPLKPQKETTESEARPALAKRSAEPATVAATPSYAPPPPSESERAESRSREQQNVGGLANVAGPRKAEPSYDKFGTMDRSRAGEMPKDSRAADDNRAAAGPQSTANRSSVEERPAATKREADTTTRGRETNVRRMEAAKKKTGESGDSADASETRSVGGRKFRRQGNSWVDTKLKSSMSIKNISRGSDEFDSLDAGLRSIAQQLGGEITVVWKGKAYRIR